MTTSVPDEIVEELKAYAGRSLCKQIYDLKKRIVGITTVDEAESILEEIIRAAEDPAGQITIEMRYLLCELLFGKVLQESHLLPLTKSPALQKQLTWHRALPDLTCMQLHCLGHIVGFEAPAFE